MTEAPAPRRRATVRVVAILAVVLHVAVGATFYAASGLLAPLYGIVVLWLLWLVLLGVLIVLARRRSWWTLAVPPGAFAVWYAALSLGEAVLDWRG